jgi:hypothetical protein
MWNMTMTQTVTIQKEEYIRLKKKAELADDIILQLDASLRDAEEGRVMPARH